MSVIYFVGVAERFIALDLKSRGCNRSEGSNPSAYVHRALPYSIIFLSFFVFIILLALDLYGPASWDVVQLVERMFWVHEVACSSRVIPIILVYSIALRRRHGVDFAHRRQK